jgi:adenosine deaminase
MPKAEIHVHVEGCLEPDTTWAMAQRNGVVLPADSLEAWREFFRFRDFDHFIEVYVAATRAICTPEDYAEMIASFYAHQARWNVRYTEAFLSCSLVLDRFKPEVIFDALAEGIRRGSAASGVEVHFIADISRERPQSRHDVVDFAIAAAERNLVIGLGLGGPEPDFPPEMFADAYAKARAAGLHVVAHAGEVEGAKSVRGAVEALGAERIGHGVRVLEDPALVAQLAERGTVFEVCPASNYALKVVADGEPHPIRVMRDAGLHVTVNSDDPSMFSTDIVRDYSILAEQDFTWDDLWSLNLATIDGTFASPERKRALREEWTAFTTA